MKHHLQLLALMLLMPALLTAQTNHWKTTGGNSMRHGVSAHTGPGEANLLWEIDAPYADFPIHHFTYDGKIFTSRWYIADGELPEDFDAAEPDVKGAISDLYCYDINTGEELWNWNYSGEDVMTFMGVDHDQVYATIYEANTEVKFWALNPEDGSVIWEIDITHDMGINLTAAFAENGDLFIYHLKNNTPYLARLDHTNGEIIWDTYNQTPIRPSGNGICVSGNTVYVKNGFFNTPQKIAAYNTETGELKYMSDELPAQSSYMQATFITAPGNVVYYSGESGMYALWDNGEDGFEQLWHNPDVGSIMNYGNYGIGIDGSVYALNLDETKILRLDPTDGSILNETAEGFTPRYFTIGADGTVYVSHKNDKGGAYIAFSPDLEELWSISHNKLPYCNVAISEGGIMVVSSKNSVSAYYTDNEPLLDPPQNLQTQIVDIYNVMLTWGAPGGKDLIGYNLYRNDELLNPGGPVTELSYTDEGLAPGVYKYGVTAVYDEGESNTTLPVVLKIVAEAAVLEGTVSDMANGSPIENALVQINEELYDSTGAGGFYRIENIPVGTYDAICEANGYYGEINTGLEFSAGETVEWNPELTAPTMELNPGSIDVSIQAGDSITEYLEIQNNGNAMLQWHAIPQINTQARSPNDEWDVQFTFDVNEPANNNYLAGAATDGQYIYAPDWNGSSIYKFDLMGNLLDEFTLPGISSIKELTYDGEYFYGSNGNTFIKKMDFENQSVEGTIYAPSNVVSIAYDSDQDGFWINEWSDDIKLINREGEILQTITNSDSFFGLAYDPYSFGAPYLWIFSEDKNIKQIDIATGNTTGLSFDITTILDCQHGGLFLQPNLVAGSITLGGIAQGSGGTHEHAFGLEYSSFPSWMKLEEFSGVVAPGESHQLGILFSWPEAGQYNGHIGMVPYPAIGQHVVDVELDVTLSGPQPQSYGINIYPNPAHDKINLTGLENGSQIHIYSLEGKHLLESRSDGVQTTLDVSGLQQGTYIIRVTAGNQVYTGMLNKR